MRAHLKARLDECEGIEENADDGPPEKAREEIDRAGWHPGARQGILDAAQRHKVERAARHTPIDTRQCARPQNADAIARHGIAQHRSTVDGGMAREDEGERDV